MRRPTAAHIMLLARAQRGDTMFGAVAQMLRTDAIVQKLFYELIDANLIEHCGRDEPMHLTRAGRDALRRGLPKTKKATP